MTLLAVGHPPCPEVTLVARRNTIEAANEHMCAAIQGQGRWN